MMTFAIAKTGQTKIVNKIITIETNACANGKFICQNKFYDKKIISSSKVNDGVCDCCDGSDEINSTCPNTCKDLSTKEYEKLMDNFLTFKMIISNYNEDNYLSYFLYNKKLMTKITAWYRELEELTARKYLIKSYINKIEQSLTEENDNFTDDNGLNLHQLRKAFDIIQEEIKINMQNLAQNENVINSFKTFSMYRDVSEECHKVNYKYFECEACIDSFKCGGYKANNKYRQKNFGKMTKFENSTLYYEQGSKCFVYNKNFTANITIECGSNEGLVLKNKVNACHYNFVFYTKIGCNSLKLESMKERIELLLQE